MTPDISLIIPFLNEADNIPRLVDTLNPYLATLRPLQVEVLFVDDGSTDASVEILQRAAHRTYAAKILSLSRNYGSHAALRAGILHARGQYITFLPADLQDPVTLIEQLYRVAQTGCDIVWAARRAVDVGLWEKIFSKCYAALMRRFALKNYPVNGFDIVMFNQRVQEELNANIEANSSIFLQILSLGFRCASLVYDKQARAIGQSKWTLSKKIKLFIDSFVAFSYAPIRFVSLAGIGLALAGLVWATYIVLRALLLGDLEQGWPTLIAVLMMGFGLTNISLGILAEYLWRTLDAARQRKVFIINRLIDVPRTTPQDAA